MFELKRLHGHFTWNAGSASGRWARAIREQDSPLIWLTCLSTPFGRELYCVNQTDHVIDSIEILRSCHACIDGEYFHKEVSEVYYQQVQPNEAVKVEHYDEYYDLDVLLGLKLRVDSHIIGKRTFCAKNVVGGTKRDEVLMWKNQLKVKTTS